MFGEDDDADGCPCQADDDGQRKKNVSDGEKARFVVDAENGGEETTNEGRKWAVIPRTTTTARDLRTSSGRWPDLFGPVQIAWNVRFWLLWGRPT